MGRPNWGRWAFHVSRIKTRRIHANKFPMSRIFDHVIFAWKISCFPSNVRGRATGAVVQGALPVRLSDIYSYKPIG